MRRVICSEDGKVRISECAHRPVSNSFGLFVLTSGDHCNLHAKAHSAFAHFYASILRNIAKKSSP
eukprot:5838689-Amphidinium_carterae.1